VGLFGRRNIAGIVFPRHIVAEYYRRTVVATDAEVVERIAVGMLRVRDLRHVADIADEKRSVYPNGDVSGEEFYEILGSSAGEGGWEQGQALIALNRLRDIRARSEADELAAFQICAEHFIQSSAVRAEKVGNVYLHGIEEGPVADNHPIMREARASEEEAAYASQQFMLASEKIVKVAPHLWAAIDARVEKGEPRKPMPSKEESARFRKQLEGWGVSLD